MNPPVHLAKLASMGAFSDVLQNEIRPFLPEIWSRQKNGTPLSLIYRNLVSAKLFKIQKNYQFCLKHTDKVFEVQD